jgi:hypothetical protein
VCKWDRLVGCGSGAWVYSRWSKYYDPRFTRVNKLFPGGGILLVKSALTVVIAGSSFVIHLPFPQPFNKEVTP